MGRSAVEATNALSCFGAGSPCVLPIARMRANRLAFRNREQFPQPDVPLPFWAKSLSAQPSTIGQRELHSGLRLSAGKLFRGVPCRCEPPAPAIRPVQILSRAVLPAQRRTAE